MAGSGKVSTRRRVEETTTTVYSMTERDVYEALLAWVGVPVPGPRDLAVAQPEVEVKLYRGRFEEVTDTRDPTEFARVTVTVREVRED